MDLQKTEAVILNSAEFSESDKILTFFTHSFGKVKGIAKGAQKSRKRFPNQLEVFSLVQVILLRKCSLALARVEACDSIESFFSISQMPAKFAHAAYFAELADAAVKDCDPHPGLFDLLVWSLRNIDRDTNLSRLSVLFYLRLLTIIGYGPTFSHCLYCSQWKGGGSSYGFSCEKGGIICSDCDSSGMLKDRLSPGTVRLLSLAQRMPLPKLSRLHFGRQVLAETEPVLEAFTHHMLDREIKSFQFLLQAKKHCNLYEPRSSFVQDNTTVLS